MTSSSRRLPKALGCLALVAALPLVAAQQQTPQFRAETNVVVIDVSVMDRNRKPVSGLTASDFTVLERGVERPLVTFTPVVVEQPPPVRSGWMRDVPNDVQNNDIRNGRLLVLVIAEGDPTIIRPTAHAIIDQMGPADLAAVAYIFRQNSSQDFTNDRAKLRMAVDRTDWAQPAAGAASLSRTMKVVLEQLAKVPDRRKTVFYIGAGLNLDFSIIAPSLDWRNAVIQGDMRYALGQLQDVMRMAQRSNVNIHTIDPAGLTVGWDARDIDPARHARDYLVTLSEETGGRAIVSNNEPQRLVPELFEMDGSYYMLGFAPSEPFDGKFRRLQVKVKRDDVEVRARSGYYVLQTLFHRGGATPAPPKQGGNLAGTIPNPDLLMRLNAIPVAPTGGKTTVVFSVGLEVPASTAFPSETTEVEIAAFDDWGKVQGMVKPRLTLKVPRNLSQPVPYHLMGRMDLKPGRYNVRAFARAQERDKRGTLFADVIVPDMSKKTALSITGLALQKTPPPIAEPMNILGTYMPIIPGTARDFARSDRVDVWFRIFRGSGLAPLPVTLRFRIADSNTLVVFEARAEQPFKAFGPERWADSKFVLPMDTLQPGPHLLTVDASIENAPTVTQRATFTIR